MAALIMREEAADKNYLAVQQMPMISIWLYPDECPLRGICAVDAGGT
ncbi:MAG TPA: hypothetical protein PK823_14890 [Novosphingobium sp.]|nr:hypothetical protein [Novosphingobium sp.]